MRRKRRSDMRHHSQRRSQLSGILAAGLGLLRAERMIRYVRERHRYSTVAKTFVQSGGIEPSAATAGKHS